MIRLAAPMLLSLALLGTAAAEERGLRGFTGVDARGDVRVEAMVGPSFSVRVEGADAEDVVTSVNNGTLRITPRHLSWFGDGPNLDAVVYVSAPRFDSFVALRGAELIVTGPVSADDIALRAMQGAALRIDDVRAQELDIRAAQGGSVDARGRCGTVHARASMGGALDAQAVECERAHVSASMGGVVSVYASEAVEGGASMGGMVDVSGAPQNNDFSAFMGGAISID